MWHKLKFLSYFFFLTSFLLAGCSLDRRMAGKLKKKIRESALLDKYDVGFELFDLEKGKMIFGKNEHRYFTPASNTKLYTFYAALMLLPEQIPALKYIEKGDSLIFWATGDPSLLHPLLPGNPVISFLKNKRKALFFSPGRYTGDLYGAGWAWDDYNEDFQAEISELPLYGNLTTFRVQRGALVLSPKIRDISLVRDTLPKGVPFGIKRDFLVNCFHLPGSLPAPDFEQQVPFKTSTDLVMTLLADTLKRQVHQMDLKMPDTARTLYGLARDSVLKQMLLPSDNFLAEQLLLLCAGQQQTEMNARKAIEIMLGQYLGSLPDRPVWVDGSGLSRYNLFSPADMVKVLELIYQKVGDRKKLFEMLPAGGYSGTLKRAYPATDQPFVFAKTGTLSGVHNQSGYIVTHKGKTYIYSFMNNNFVQPVSDVRKEMVRIMTYIHENF